MDAIAIHRRAFLRQSSLLLAGSALASADALRAAETADPLVRIGLATDLHYADKPPAGARHYRETLSKFAEAAERFQREKVDCIVELGDIIDAADAPDVEEGYLQRIAKEFAAVHDRRYYVVGNHCVDTLTKAEFLEIVGQESCHQSFDLKGYHWVVLDACFRGDGEPYGRKNFQWTDANVPAAELDWLKADLARTPHKTVVFIHQRIDVEGLHSVKNAAEVRKVLEGSGKVLAVLQGHFHRNDYREVGGIHYCTLAAMVEGSGEENNAYALLDILPGHGMRIAGFRKQKGYEWPQ
ncbi:MAG: metallophosphoesterase family protein [Pirellulales bacterium]|nr:metallophosphoesterase family protein [Pirellulales bacterium]